MGKSTAAEFLRSRGAQVVDTDELARQLVQRGQPALNEIQAAFGKRLWPPAAGSAAMNWRASFSLTPRLAKNSKPSFTRRIRERWLAQIETWRKGKPRARRRRHSAAVRDPGRIPF